MEETIENIKTNDLAHIGEDIKDVKETFKEMRSTLNKILIVAISAFATFVLGLIATLVKGHLSF
jgi:hypothetical protein